MAKNRNIIREQNLALVMRQFFKNERLLAADLVKLTGISMVTINSLLKDLVKENKVLEGKLIQKEIGRPAVEYSLNTQILNSLFVSIRAIDAQLYVYSYYVDVRGRVLETNKIFFSDVTEAGFQAIMKEQIASYEDIYKIGILFPGKISNGIAVSSLHDVFNQWNFAKIFSELTSVPVAIQNDAHLLTIGHCIQNKISLNQAIVGIFLPKNSMPGITLIANNDLIEGNNALAGEAKYLPSLIRNGAPQNQQEMLECLIDILGFYNAAFAPKNFVLYVDGLDQSTILERVAADTIFPQQKNKLNLQFVEDFEDSARFGIHWMLFQNTPFSFSD